ncbi:hypothetical protein BKI52_35835 [marine bacterium AO1-C]|nr:hypothetical protein BKI52_35835 [marine bacterium AO1-C]
MLGGSVGFSTNDDFAPPYNYYSSKVKNITLSPTIGYFFNNHWQVGIRGQYHRGKSNQKWSNLTNTNSINNFTELLGLGAYVRRYIWMFDHLAFHIEASALYTQSISNTDSYDETNQKSQWRNTKFSKVLYLTPGFTLKVNKRIGIDLSTNLLRIGHDKDHIQDFNLNHGADEWQSNTFNAKLSNFEALLNDVQIGITIFI